MNKLEIVAKLIDNKGIQIGRTVFLFNKPRMVVGFWNNSLVFAADNPNTMSEAQVLIYTINELKEIYKEGSLQGLVEIDG